MATTGIIVAAVATAGLGCGETSVAERLGQDAAKLQGRTDELSVKAGRMGSHWPGAENVALVICGAPDGLLLDVARYESVNAARSAARRIGRRRLLCVVSDTVVESWLYPYDAADEARADRQGEALARKFCTQARGHLTGHWRAWEFS